MITSSAKLSAAEAQAARTWMRVKGPVWSEKYSAVLHEARAAFDEDSLPDR